MGIIVPHSRELADSLIRYSKDGTWNSIENFCVPVNVTKMVVYCLETSDYRREELWGVLESNLQGIRQNWFSKEGLPLADYRDESSVGIEMTIMNALGIIGGYLNWKDSPMPNEELEGIHNPRGFGYRYIVRIDDAGKPRVLDITQSHTPYRK